MSAIAFAQEPSEARVRRPRTDWPASRIAALRENFLAGLSHELIAQRLGTTKGTISAKLARLADADPDTWRRSATIIALKPDRNAAAAKAEGRRAQAAMAKAIEESVIGVALLDLQPCSCRWPMAYTAEQTFCGAAQASGSSYCGDHDARSRSGTKGPA